MEENTLKLTGEQARGDGQRHLVLNGDPDGPATTIARDAKGQDVRAASAEEAFGALGGGHHYSHVELVEHEFPDAGGGRTHRVKVWAPVNRKT